MIKESRYILRRILIGVGIVFCFSFINSCKVKALTTFDGFEVCDLPSGINEQDNAIYINVFDAGNVRMVVTSDNNLKVTGNNVNSWQRGYNVYECEYRHYDSNSGQWINDITNSTWVYKGTTTRYYAVLRPESVFLDYLNNTEPGVNRPSSLEGGFYFNKNVLNQDNSVYLNYSTFSQYLPIQTPEFLSFNAEKRVNNNILLGYFFKPEFSSFDTDNYIYQYKVGTDSTNWLGLSQNKQLIDINSNTTLYVRVIDLQNNIVDSATFTVSGVGNFTNSQNVEYDIKFSGEYRTGGNLEGKSSGGSSIIDEYQIYTDFIPNSSILKYQYQWVPVGSSLDSNSWVDITLSPTDYGDFTYVVNQNGVFYARILDFENNLKYSSTFTVNTIGKLAIDSGNDKITDKFMSISNKLNIGGPISGIIEIPLKVINIIGTGLAGGLTCNNYSLGTLWGTNLVIPCVNIRQHLGDSLYTTIDLIIACVMIYNIYKMIMEMYTNFIFMQKNPVDELGNRGD